MTIFKTALLGATLLVSGIVVATYASPKATATSMSRPTPGPKATAMSMSRPMPVLKATATSMSRPMPSRKATATSIMADAERGVRPRHE